jgi:hypothetical protein
VKDHNEGIDNDLLTTNEKIGQLETTQIDTNNKLAGVEATFARMDRSLSSFVRRFDEMYAKINCGYGESSKKTDSKKADGKKDDKNDESFEDNWDDYVADTEQEDRDRQRLRTDRRGMGGFRRGREVHVKNDGFSKIKFKIPPFVGKYVPDAYITWEIAVDQKFECHEFPENTRVKASTSEFTDFASVWWIEHSKKNPNNIP